MIFIAIIGLLTGIILTRRLEILSSAAKKIKDGQLNIQTNLKGSDELGLLGQAFDSMVYSFKITIDQLRSGEDKLRDAHSKLEYRVQERTSELANANQELERLALYDPLSGLPNRILMLKNLHKALDQELSFSVLMMDLDRFKEVNDTLGHDIGDELLIQVGARVANLLRKSDTVSRIGGDEFAMILADVSQEQSILVAKKIVTSLSEEFSIRNNTFSIGCSIGISTFPLHGSDSVTLLKCADLAMYSAKRNHLGHVLYDASDNRQSETNLSLRAELRNAIEHNELVLHYQPKVNLTTNLLVGVEALVRWQQHEELTYPDKFIPYAEKTGLIRDVTKWVLTSAIKQLSEWLSMNRNIKMSVNLSFKDLDDNSLVTFILDILNDWKVPSKNLILEITETSVMENPNRTLEVLHQLNKIGLGISIDDFGTGYSSMMYLKKLPINEIKIDRSFVADLITNKDSLVIVRSIIDLAHNLGMSVTAEGVESQEILEKLIELKCDISQGYHTGRPMINADLIQTDLFLKLNPN